MGGGEWLRLHHFSPPLSLLDLLNCPYLIPWVSLLLLLLFSPPACWVTELLPKSSCATSMILNVLSAKRNLPGDNTTPCSIFVFMQRMKFVRGIIYPELSVTELRKTLQVRVGCMSSLQKWVLRCSFPTALLALICKFKHVQLYSRHIAFIEALEPSLWNISTDSQGGLLHAHHVFLVVSVSHRPELGAAQCFVLPCVKCQHTSGYRSCPALYLVQVHSVYHSVCPIA